MKFSEWVRQVKAHWAEFQPARYQALVEQGILDQALHDAAERTNRELSELEEAGIPVHEAWIMVREKYLFPPREDCSLHEEVEGQSSLDFDRELMARSNEKYRELDETDKYDRTGERLIRKKKPFDTLGLLAISGTLLGIIAAFLLNAAVYWELSLAWNYGDSVGEFFSILYRIEPTVGGAGWEIVGCFLVHLLSSLVSGVLLGVFVQFLLLSIIQGCLELVIRVDSLFNRWR